MFDRHVVLVESILPVQRASACDTVVPDELRARRQLGVQAAVEKLHELQQRPRGRHLASQQAFKYMVFKVKTKLLRVSNNYFRSTVFPLAHVPTTYIRRGK